MMLSFLATPTRSQKSRSASGVKPRRRRPTIVGMRGSSQPRDVLLDDELQQLALAHHRVGEVQARELDLLRPRRHRQVGQQPVVERPVILELERAQRVRDLLDGVRDRMGVVVGRIDRPRVAGAMVRDAPHAVEHRVAHVDVRRRHVDLGAQHQRAVLELAGAHPREQVEVLGHRSIAVRAVLARLGQRAAVLADLVGRQVVDVGQAGPDQVLRRSRRAPRSSRRRRAGRSSRSRASCTSALIESTYSTSSLAGLVSSKRRLQLPPNSRATPKFRQIDLAWPMCRYPFGSGGKRVATRPA